MKKLLLSLILVWLFLNIHHPGLADNYYQNLENKIFHKIKHLPGRQGVGFLDLRTGENFYVSKNLLFPSASVIKLPIMAAVYCEAAAGNLNLNQRLTLRTSYKLGGSGILKHAATGNVYTIRQLVDLMITKSDNTATYMLIRKVGQAQINRQVRSFGLKRTFLGDITLLAERPGNWQNLTTPADILKLLDLIYQGKIAGRAYCREMISVMKNQTYTWGIPRKLPQSVEVANKTGYQTGVLNDAGIIFTPRGNYALAVFVSGINNMHTERKIINDISCNVYQVFMNKEMKTNLSKNKSRMTYTDKF